MKLVINKKQILSNIQKAEQLMGSASVALVFKDFYQFLFDEIFEDYVIFSNNLNTKKQVTYHIANDKASFGKILVSENQIERFLPVCERVYLPLNYKDNREGLSVENFLKITEKYREYKDKIWLLITSGCSNEKAPTNEELFDIYQATKNRIVGISIGGSFYLQRSIPSFIDEIRIGEYFLLGTIPYADDKTNFQKSAVIFETEVLETYPERNQILVNGGYATLNAKENKLLSKGLYFSDTSSDYTIYNDFKNRYKVGDKIRIIPSYKSLITLQHIEREYT